MPSRAPRIALSCSIHSASRSSGEAEGCELDPQLDDVPALGDDDLPGSSPSSCSSASSRGGGASGSAAGSSGPPASRPSAAIASVRPAG